MAIVSYHSLYEHDFMGRKTLLISPLLIYASNDPSYYLISNKYSKKETSRKVSYCQKDD